MLLIMGGKRYRALIGALAGMKGGGAHFVNC
jgi:hypothetical protein